MHLCYSSIKIYIDYNTLAIISKSFPKRNPSSQRFHWVWPRYPRYASAGIYFVHIFEQNRITVIEYIIKIKLHFILLVFSVALNFSIYIILSGTEPLSLSTLVAEMDLFEYFLYWNIIFNSLYPYFSSSVSGNLFHNTSKLNECLWAFFAKYWF